MFYTRDHLRNMRGSESADSARKSADNNRSNASSASAPHDFKPILSNNSQQAKMLTKKGAQFIATGLHSLAR